MLACGGRLMNYYKAIFALVRGIGKKKIKRTGTYSGPERRKYPRLNTKLAVNYRILSDNDVGHVNKCEHNE